MTWEELRNQIEGYRNCTCDDCGGPAVSPETVSKALEVVTAIAMASWPVPSALLRKREIYLKWRSGYEGFPDPRRKELWARIDIKISGLNVTFESAMGEN